MEGEKYGKVRMNLDGGPTRFAELAKQLNSVGLVRRLSLQKLDGTAAVGFFVAESEKVVANGKVLYFETDLEIIYVFNFNFNSVADHVVNSKFSPLCNRRLKLHVKVLDSRIRENGNGLVGVELVRAISSHLVLLGVG
jgi:hypothetical protein